MFIKDYITDIFKAIKSLLTGMKQTGYYFVHPKEIITEQYPDNRDTLVMAERFRGEVVMPHDENNEHACTGCTACELACPNATIKIITKFDITPEGKKKKALDTFVYHLELCTMCNLCIEACPTDAIKMAQNFEHSVYDRSKLIKKLNKYFQPRFNNWSTLNLGKVHLNHMIKKIKKNVFPKNHIDEGM